MTTPVLVAPALAAPALAAPVLADGVGPLLAGVALLLLGGFAMLRSDGAKAAERRHLETRLRELRLNDHAELAAGAAWTGLSRDLPRWLSITLARADIVPRIEPILLAGGIIAAAAGLSLLLAGWMAAVAVIVAASGGGGFALRMIARRRMARFADGLPFFLDTARQMLTTGNSVQQALTRASENSGAEMQRYLLPMVRRMQNGASVGDSVTWLADRLNILELHMFATAIQTNIRYGGRLSLVLSNLIAVLRDRSRVLRELKAATAETRMSGLVLAALPVGAGAFIMVTNSAYLQFFIQTEQGNHLLMLAVALQLLGMAAMRWLMKLDY
jgi:tight adherence protein B